MPPSKFSKPDWSMKWAGGAKQRGMFHQGTSWNVSKKHHNYTVRTVKVWRRRKLFGSLTIKDPGGSLWHLGEGGKVHEQPIILHWRRLDLQCKVLWTIPLYHYLSLKNRICRVYCISLNPLILGWVSCMYYIMIFVLKRIHKSLL